MVYSTLREVPMGWQQTTPYQRHVATLTTDRNAVCLLGLASQLLAKVLGRPSAGRHTDCFLSMVRPTERCELYRRGLVR